MYFHLVEDACEVISPDLQIAYDYCNENYEVHIQNYFDYDHIIKNGDTIISGSYLPESGKHIVNFKTGDCQNSIVLELPIYRGRFSPFEVTQTIPEGTYYETDIITAGIVEESNQVYFIPNETVGLNNNFSVDKGSALTVIKENCIEAVSYTHLTLPTICSV